jgi:membrane-bound lytic murein transglycosylase B
MAVRSLSRTGILLSILLCPAAASASGAAGGWDYLIDKLAADGIDRAWARAVFTDPRVPPFTGLTFSLAPRESRALYRGFLRPASIARARRCRIEHDRELRRAERRLGVPADLLGAILHVETQCGHYTGRQVVLHRLARLAMANEPANLRSNIRKQTKGLSGARRLEVEQQVRRRARHLEDTFYPEVLATFHLAERLRIDPLGIRGSPSGAFGLPQFLPSSYLRFAVDGNGDERVSLYDPADAIASMANYLVAHGWKPNLSRSEQRRVIWAYNHSDAYIDAVLALADRIAPPTSRRRGDAVAER